MLHLSLEGASPAAAQELSWHGVAVLTHTHTHMYTRGGLMQQCAWPCRWLCVDSLGIRAALSLFAFLVLCSDGLV